ncbi:MAG: Crp/Fnr family transcriptional regulator [Acidobacteriota bacterium]|nr:Crp/Fnr family transcriptional regulator [Acidobacteriota bacterium]
MNTPQLPEHQDCRVLTGITFEHLPQDRGIGHPRKCRKGSYMWTSDTRDHHLYFLERGQVVIMISDEAGCEVIVRVIQPGEPFGELCFCTERDRPRQNCAQAVVDSDILEIAFDDFMSYLQKDADALCAFTFTFCKRLADAERRIEVLSHRGAEARLGRLLLQLAESRSLEGSNPDIEIKLPVGHDELARMAAMTRPHVSVTMGKLRDRGLVHYSRGHQLTVQVTGLVKYLNQGKTTAEK